MIYRIEDLTKFKEDNLQNWYRNSDFWLQGSMRHLKDVYPTTAALIRELLRDSCAPAKQTLVDFGCGEGWVLRVIDSESIDVKYIGVDFNRNFIDALEARYRARENTSFILHDLEQAEMPASLIGAADLAVNFFNFFEIPRLAEAFHNVARAIKPGGFLVTLSIDPIMQLLAVSDTMEEFRASLVEYERSQMELGYDKDIDVGDFKSGRVYKSVLYSSAVYAKVGKANGLQLMDYREIVKTANFVPQIYQYLIFRKRKEPEICEK